MALVLRSTKGSPLLHSEVDGNWAHCSPTVGTTQENLDQKGTLAAPNTWTKANCGAYQALTSSSNSIAVDLSLSNNFNHTLTENTLLNEPTNIVAGQAGVIEFTQGSGSYTLGFNAFWKWVGGTCPEISTDEGDVSLMSYIVSSDASFATCVWLDPAQPCPGG
jgi:hypothetical protein